MLCLSFRFFLVLMSWRGDGDNKAVATRPFTFIDPRWKAVKATHQGLQVCLQIDMYLYIYLRSE